MPACADMAVVPKVGPTTSSCFVSVSQINYIGLQSGYSSRDRGPGAASTMLLLFSVILIINLKNKIKIKSFS